MLSRLFGTALVIGVAILVSHKIGAQTRPAFSVDETTIAQIHAALKAGTLTCRALVDAYLRRIDAYDKRGPAINAIVQVNRAALDEASALDRQRAANGLTGRLHCIPVIVKDNFETVGLQSAAGSLALKGFVSTRDAFQVQRLKEAGAIVLAKSNMGGMGVHALRDGQFDPARLHEESLRA